MWVCGGWDAGMMPSVGFGRMRDDKGCRVWDDRRCKMWYIGCGVQGGGGCGMQHARWSGMWEDADRRPLSGGGDIPRCSLSPFPTSLQRPVHHVVPPSAVTEDYLRSFRPYHTAEDLRMSSLPPLGLDPAAAAAYYHPSYLTHHPFPHPAFRYALTLTGRDATGRREEGG